MSERYCPVCKQNVDVADEYIFTPCFNCGYAFGVVVDKAELVELVKLAELVGWRGHSGAISGESASKLEELAAKFRAKYLEGK